MKNILEYIDDLIAQGYTEEQAYDAASYEYFGPDDENYDPYDYEHYQGR